MSEYIPVAHTISPRPRLAAARFDRRWSQQELAERLGTTPLNISRWERGLTTPGPYFRKQLQRVFDLTEEELAVLLGEYEAAAVQDAEEEQGRRSDTHALYDPGIPLPAGMFPLVGRDEELGRLKESLLTSQQVARSALSGLPGVGKTALALELAYDPEIREHFSDGVLWAGLGPQPHLPSILARWGQLLGIGESDASTISTPERWHSLLRNLIGERRLLLVLDDAWKLEDVLACQVGGINCGYVLTTRLPQLAQHFTIRSTLVIPELDEQQSLQMLQQVAPEAVRQEPEQIQALLKAVGGLPLALTLVGNALRLQSYSGQPRRIRAALTALQNAQSRLELSDLVPSECTPALCGAPVSLQATLAVSERILSHQARLALHALSVLPAKPETFGEEAAIAICQQPVEVLDELSDAGLLESVGEARYALHQVISDYARLQLNDPDAPLRLIAYSVQYARQHAQRYDALATESALLLHALSTCNEHHRPHDLLALILVLAPFWQARGAYSLIDEYLPPALEAAQAFSLPWEQIQLLLQLGESEYQRGADEQALKHYEKALYLESQMSQHHCSLSCS